MSQVVFRSCARAAGGVLLSASLCACGAPVPGDENGRVVDEWTVGTNPVMVIGAATGQAEYEFHGVRAAFRLSSGVTVVGDAGSGELRYFDDSGVWLGSKGRVGEGPGEFRFLHSAGVIRGDSVFAWDIVSQRLTLFPPDRSPPLIVSLGRHGGEGTVREPPTLVTAQMVTMTWSGELWATGGSSGALLVRRSDQAEGRDPIERGGTHVLHLRGPVRRMGRSGELLQSVTNLPAGPLVVRDGQPQPWPMGGWLMMDAGRNVVILGVGSDRVMRIIGQGGLVERVFEFGPGHEINDALWEAFSDQVVSQRGRWWERFLADMPRPDTLAHYSDLIVDDRDRVWTGEFQPLGAGPERLWRVFDLNGRHLAMVRLPIDLEVMDVRDGLVTGVRRDDLDVERIEVYRLQGDGL